MAKASKAQKGTLIKVLHHVRRYLPFVGLSVLLAAVSVASTLLIPVYTGDAVDLILGPGQVDFAGLFRLMQRMGVVLAAGAAAQWLMNLCNNRITYSVIRDLRREAFEKIQQLPLSYLDGRTTGEVVSRVVADVDQFADGLLMGFTQLFTGVLTIVGTLGFMLRVNWAITLVVVCVTPLSLGVAAFIAKKTYSMFRLQSETRGEQTSLIDEMVAGQKVVQAFGQEEKVLARFDEINGRLEQCSLRAIFFSSITNPATRFVNSLVYAGVCVTGAVCAVQGLVSVGQLSCLLSYANQYTKPFNEISGVVTELQNALACAGRVLELIEAPAQTVKPGERVAIVGPTGCGKTTIINLLMRFYDPNSGKITVEGVDETRITRKSLRSAYGMVLQDTWLKAGTIRENIAYGAPDATEEQIVAAAKAAHAHGFIQRLPQGYDTVIAEDGGNISQGQKQLLCIARVMLCLPPMLILDEATSSIDTRTEARIQKAFQQMMEGRTSFIVAHRLSTIRQADVILVMKDGHVIEQGTHDQLLAKGGFYANLYNSQFEDA